MLLLVLAEVLEDWMCSLNMMASAPPGLLVLSCLMILYPGGIAVAILGADVGVRREEQIRCVVMQQVPDFGGVFGEAAAVEEAG